MRRRVTEFWLVMAFVAVAAAISPGSRADAAIPPSGNNCGTTQIPKTTGGSWQCSFSDDFDGTVLDDSKWIPQQTKTSGYLNGMTACFVDSPNNVSVANGTLRLTARQEPWFWCPVGWFGFPTMYTSGMVSTWGKFSQAYGRFEVRAKISPAKVRGLHTAFWLWPVDSNRYGAYPASGEIDIAELYSAYPDRAIPYLHYNAAPGTNAKVTDNHCAIPDPSAFHTYAVEWTPSSIRIIYDGNTCMVESWHPAAPLTAPQPFDQPFLIALTQALGVGDNAFNPWATPLPATTEVDYVRVWK